MKAALKAWLAYRPDPAIAPVRRLLAEHIADKTLPVCPPWEGDVIAESVRETNALTCLELGFHTGSSALYMLHEVAPRGGRVVSIDPLVSGSVGPGLVAASGHAAAHELIRGTSQEVLPDLLRRGRTFDFVFLDGWKTFDALAVDAYFVARLLRVGGMVMFDDHRMPSVRQVMRLLETHYRFARRSSVPRQTSELRHRLYLAAITRSFYFPFARLQKTMEVEAAPIADWHFYQRF